MKKLKDQQKKKSGDKSSPAEKAAIMHEVSSLYMSANMPRDYGDGRLYTATEVHMLEYIVDHPGRSVTELSEDWDKSKPALSQMLKKMEKKDLVHHTSAIDSLRKQLYYPTPYGEKVNRLHIAYDNRVFGDTLAKLGDLCTQAEIETCFHVLEKYIQISRTKHYRSKPE